MKTLEIEELSNRDCLLDGYLTNRHVHAERNVQEKRLDHFDVAAKVYPKDRYDRRYDAQLGDPGERPRKIKLFRIDGDIDPVRWLELIGHFFSDNEMIIEYFDPIGFEEYYALQIREYQEHCNAST